MISSSTTLLERSLTTAAAELKYEQSSHLVDILAKDEDLRRVRFEASIREDDVHELRDLLSQESDRSAAFEKLVGQNLLRAEGAEARMATLQEELRSKEQQLSTLAAERAALEHVATDATTALTEKLALTRELSILKPQLEHLQSQATATESLMAEKLSLQRELAEAQCDLENAKREAKRALAKRRNTGAEIAQEEQMDELRRQLAKEKRARQRAEEAMDTTQSDAGVDEVRRELAREKRARQKVEDRLEEALNATQIEEVRSDLLKEKKAKDKLREKLEKLKAELEDERRKTNHTSSEVSDLETETLVKSLRDQLESARSELEVEKQKSLSRPEAATSKSTIDEDTTQELRDQLAVEKRERARIDKALQASTTAFEAQKATLEDKLNQFRDKLRSTKDKLKATEAELTQVRETSAGAATVRPSDLFVSKVAKKRNQAQMDPDANALGTPGDGPAKKTSRRNGPSGVGDKSTFSITPFLSRTTSVAPESEDDDAEVASPTVAPRQPLSEQPNTSSNIQKPKKTAGRKLKTAPVLQVVAEEVEESRPQGQENASNLDQPLATKVKTKTADGPEKLPGKRQKLRKSIHDFSSFNPEPELKKKRKLAGLGKTLFDDDDNDALPAKSLPAKGLFGGMSLGGKGRKGGLLGAPKLGAGLSCAAESNAAPFSPLKRTRRNLDDTLRG